MAAIENISTWQIFMLAIPSYLIGGLITWMLLKERIQALEALVLEEPKKNLTSEQIAKNLIKTLYDN